MTIQRDIRLLAKEPKLKAKLGAPRNRDPIPGKVTPFTDDTFATASTAPAADSGSGGECNTNPNDTEQQENDQVSDPNDPNSFYKGGAGSTSTGSTDSTTETGVQDIDSVMDGDTSGDGSDSYSTDPEPAIKGLTNLTDKDGNCFTVRMDGTFPAPDGWEDADTPPEDTDWQLGAFFFFTGELIDQAPTPGILFAQAPDVYPLATHLEKYTYIANVEPAGNTGVIGYIEYRQTDPFDAIQINLNQGVCDPGVESYCPTEAPTEGCWPSTDGCYTLSAIDGTFQTNEHDCNAPKNWEPKSTIYSYENGVPKYAVTGTATGGHMIYETEVNGAPKAAGTARVYGPNGNMVAAGDATSQFMDQYLPK